MKGSASEATYVALLAARSRMLARLIENNEDADRHSFMSKLVMYCSHQVAIYLFIYLFAIMHQIH